MRVVKKNDIPADILHMDNRCVLQLCDPDGLTAGEAMRLARKVSSVEPSLAPNVGALADHLIHRPNPDLRRLRRALEVLSAISDERAFSRTCERMLTSSPDAAPLHKS